MLEPRSSPTCRALRHRLIAALQLNELEDRVEAYYAAAPDLHVFHTSSHNPLEWGQVLAEVNNRPGSQSPVTILEFGAGLCYFPAWLRDQLTSSGTSPLLAFTCYDVASTNFTQLQHVADELGITLLQKGVLPPASFDIIFSTHCLEHVARPEQLIHTLTRLLKPGGCLLLFAPGYDLPIYLTPLCG